MEKEKTHEVKESRIKELAGICPEYKNAMHILFPEAFVPEETNITFLIDWKTCRGTTGGCFLEGFYKGKQIAFVNPTDDYDKENGVGVRILSSERNNYKVVWCSGHTFKIVKKWRSNNE